MKVEIDTTDEFSIRLYPETDEDREILGEFPYPMGHTTAGSHIDGSIEVVIKKEG